MDEYIAPELFLLLIISLFTFYHCLLYAIIFCRFHVIGVGPYPTFILHCLMFLPFISLHLTLPYLIYYLSLPYLVPYLTLHFALPYLTFCLSLPYFTLPYILPCLTLPYLTSGVYNVSNRGTSRKMIIQRQKMIAESKQC